MLSNRFGIVLATALAPAIWGTTYLVTTELLPPGRPLLAAVVRALPAGLVLVAITRRLPRGVWWWRALVLGALNIGAFFALLFVAAYRLPGGVAATIGAVQPLLAAGLSAGLLGERLSLRTVIAGGGGRGRGQPARPAGRCAAGRARGRCGRGRRGGHGDRRGAQQAVGGARAAAGGDRLATRRRGSAVAAGRPARGGAAPPASLTGENLAGYGYLAIIGSAFAYALWFRGIRALSATDVTFLGLLSPLVATTAGWLVLGQELTLAQAAGGLVVLAALIVAQTRRPLSPATRRS
ncbi:EamA family transporter [Streptomyces olivoverticillatus]